MDESMWYGEFAVEAEAYAQVHFPHRALATMRDEARAEAFEEAKRIVDSLRRVGFSTAYDRGYDEALARAIAALDRAAASTPQGGNVSEWLREKVLAEKFDAVMARDRMWCLALINTLDPEGIAKVTGWFVANRDGEVATPSAIVLAWLSRPEVREAARRALKAQCRAEYATLDTDADAMLAALRQLAEEEKVSDKQGPAIDPEAMRRLARSWSDTGTDWMRNFGQWALARDTEASRLAVRIHPCEQHRDEVMKGGECPWHTIERLEQENARLRACLERIARGIWPGENPAFMARAALL